MPRHAPAARYFVGLPLPEEVRDVLSDYTPAGADIRNISGQKLHITLHFLGQLEQAEVASSAAVLQTLSQESFSLTIAGGGQFPSQGRARVLWAGVRENERLAQLHSECGRLLSSAIGFVPERRPFRPHVTLARCGTKVRTADVDRFLKSTAALNIANISVDSVVLFRSRLHPATRNYEAVETIALHPA